ncbi:tellurium resistance protein [Streptomyces beigongshangae]|uniref:tellurium resistance protein n=1 Tax=Streptomyces beigongshangae TaxID=2841597 RepID=UPI001C84614A|nr:tellurium resistance protein [Streptomyces sp. REN17]
MTTTTDSASEIGRRWIFQDFWGFERAPGETDFSAYGKALLICANGDGELAPQERDYVVGLIAGMHGPDDVVEELKTYAGTDDLQTVLRGGKGAAESGGCLVYDTIRVCSADGTLASGELEKIHEAADTLGISRDAVQQMIEIDRQERELSERRLRLCYPNADSRPF